MRNNTNCFGKNLWKYVLMLLVCVLLAGCGSDATKELLTSLGEDVDSPECVASEAEQTEGTDENGSQDMQDDKVTESATIFVHVCGAVKEQDVYELPAGCRFYEAVEAAGGFREDACVDYLNLASILSDGDRLEIPTYTQVREAKQEGLLIAPDGSMSIGTSAESGLININTADVGALCSLPGIGESRAESIIAYREEKGPFLQKEDIMNVTGIKEGMYGKIADLITVE